MNKKKWVHFVAVCGPTVGSIAILLKKQGWKVTGSDKDIYPPASDFLAKSKIHVLEGFDGSRITKHIDLVVLGGGAMIMDKDNPEVKRSLELGIKTISWPEFVSGLLVKKESIVVGGTYGKTTTTAMISWILKKSGQDPSYLIGGYANNFNINVHLADTRYFVIEGDEHPSALHFDDKSKFLYYSPKYLLLTSAKWDHFNVFPKEKDYINTFTSLIKLVPKNGFVILCKNGDNLRKIASHAKCKVIWYSAKDYTGKLNIVGKFNRENAAGAMALCRELGIKKELILSSLSTFRGVKRRLEKKAETRNSLIIEDFAQHPYKVKEVLKTLKNDYPDRKIILIYDPFASILRTHKSLSFYKNMFTDADYVFIRRAKVSLDKNDRVTGPGIVKAIDLPDKRARYLPLDNDISDEVLKISRGQKTVVVFCSSGGWKGLIEKVIRQMS